MLAHAAQRAAEPVGVRGVPEHVGALEPVRLGQSPLVKGDQVVRSFVVPGAGEPDQAVGERLDRGRGHLGPERADTPDQVRSPGRHPIVEYVGHAVDYGDGHLTWCTQDGRRTGTIAGCPRSRTC